MTLSNGCEFVPVDLLTRGMVLMESPERSIGTVERVVPSMGWVHVELLDGGSERVAPRRRRIVPVVTMRIPCCRAKRGDDRNRTGGPFRTFGVVA